MTVGQLRELLEQFPDDQEVMMVYQPSYPLRCAVAGVWEEEADDRADGEEAILYVVAGEDDYKNPYGSSRAFLDCQSVPY